MGVAPLELFRVVARILDTVALIQNSTLQPHTPKEIFEVAARNFCIIFFLYINLKGGNIT